MPGSADKPLFVFPVNVVAGDLADVSAAPVVSLLWTDPLQHHPDLLMPPSFFRVTPKGTGQFNLEIFRNPPPEAIVDIPAHAPSTDSTRLAIAEIVVLEDVNGDGQLAVTGPRGNVSPDRYLASSHDVLAFIDRPFRSGIPSILTASGLARWQLVHYDCDGRLTKEVQGGGMADMVVLPSSSFPEVRSCRRSHSP
jgi:hypothetical protein